MLWLKSLLASMSMVHQESMTLIYDNQLAIYIVASSVFREHTKHIDVDCHNVREQIQTITIVTSHVKS